MDEKRIKRLMETLLCSREEAISVIEDDKRIDQGEKLFELTDEQKKNAKAVTITTNATPTTKTKTPREKKVNTEKQTLLAALVQGVGEVEELEIQNDEREFTFKVNGTKYKVVLSAPRS